MKTPSTSLAGLDLLSSAVIVLDAQGRITYVNPAAESLLDSSCRALSQQKLTTVFMNGDELMTVFEQAVAHHGPDTVDEGSGHGG